LTMLFLRLRSTALRVGSGLWNTTVRYTAPVKNNPFSGGRLILKARWELLI
jgi:hypothetical protein